MQRNGDYYVFIQKKEKTRYIVASNNQNGEPYEIPYATILLDFDSYSPLISFN